ncbi:MAG: HD domain-containing phosphohydrolase [Rhodothermaceae bacterium]
MREKILFVDDEENVLKAYQRNLRSKFQVTTFTNAKDALQSIHGGQCYSVVVSDYNMPGMNGVEFLSKITEVAPDTVRLMLTGYADVNTAIKAVNDGHVFRILTKPCETENLVKNINAAIDQYNLITAEKELLDKTLKGSIKILIDVLGVVSPTAFSQATAYRQLAKNIAVRLGFKKYWEIEIAALLSQIGCVAVPSEIIHKRASGNELLDEEHQLFVAHPQTGKKLLQNIPRLEKIAEAIEFQFNRYDGGDLEDKKKSGENMPLISRILKVINDFDSFVKSGIDRPTAVDLMKADPGCYDEKILCSLEAEVQGIQQSYNIRYINVKQLETGMILGENLVDSNNTTLVSKDNEITEILIAKIQNYARLRTIKEPFKVMQLR